MRITLLLAVLALCGCSLPGEAPTSGPPDPFKVLILGDSISIGYTPFVREMLAEQATVVRPMAKNGKGSENCAGTTYGKDHIDRWLNLEGGGFDVVHFNFGLHDLKRVNPETGKNSNDPNDPHQADLALYTTRLRLIALQLQASGARVVFGTTTPVPDGGVRPHRDPLDVLRYNAAARGVMDELGIPVNDLFATASSGLEEYQKPTDVHFNKAGSLALAEQVVEGVRVLAWR